MYSLPIKSNIRLILLEGNKENRLACKHALSQYKDCVFVILEAETGYQCLKMARTHQPDCILLGHHLPDMQSAEFLSELAECSNEQSLPVVILTSQDNTADTLGLRQAINLHNASDHSVLNGLSAEILRIMLEQQAIKDRSNALNQLRESEAKYRNLVQQLPVITYIASLESPVTLTYVSPQINRLGYLAKDWLDSPDGLFRWIHPVDLAITIEAYAYTYEHHAPLRCEYRLIDMQGKIRWFLDEATIVRDEAGESLFLQGVLVDISKDKEIEQELCYYRQRLEELVVQRTQQLENQCEVLRSANANLDQALIALKQSHSELRTSETRIRLLLESAGEGIIGLNGSGSCTFINCSALTMLGYTKDEVLDQDIRTMMGWASLEHTQLKEDSWVENLLRDCVNLNNIQTFRRKDDSHFLAECASYPIEINGVIDSSVLVFRDISKFDGQFRKLAYRASHDPLTGLVNRSEFERRLVRVLADMQADEREHVLCFLDLDHFKQINDSHGHAAGDHVLRSFCSLLTSKLRQRDTLARLGGDEFALLLEHTTLNCAYAIAHELCECVSKMSLTWANRELSVSVSIGLCALTEVDGDFAHILCHADNACYEAKKQGRNQIHAFTYSSPKCLELSALNS